MNTSRKTRRTRRTVQAVAVAGLLACAQVVPVHAAGNGDGGVGEIPVLGQQVAEQQANGVDNATMVVSLHAVRRVRGGTVLYYSVHGLYPDGRRSLTGMGLFARVPRLTTEQWETALVIDPARTTVYLALPRKGKDEGIRTKGNAVYAPAGSPQAWVQMVAVAPLPADLTRVDVIVAGAHFQGVPVTDGGPLQPMASDDGAPVLGTAWPKVDENVIAEASAAVGARAAEPVTFPVADLDGGLSTRDTAGGTNVDLRSDVLFAFDQATLTPAAKAEIAKVASEITARGIRSGTVEVTGHTDSQGDHARNVTLSQQRADAVAAELRRGIPAGVILRTSGKAEADPVASNKTDEGRAKNRRVTVLIPKGK